MMKKIIIITILIVSLFGCSEEFLDKVPTTSSVVENFYASPEDATTALTAVYNMLLRDDWWSLHIYGNIRDDIYAGGAGSGDGGGFQLIDRGLPDPNAAVNSQHWSNYWGAVYRANTYLSAEGQIDWTGKEQLQKQYQAEARFLRAYYHFYLTRMFGEIPALDKVITPDVFPPRTNAEELYSFILDDLVFAAENALGAKYGSMDPVNWGRVTKWAAESMIARVYLFYSGYYNQNEINGINAEKALSYVENVINNSGHGLVSEYASLWRVPTVSELGDLSHYAGENNQEVVWSVRHTDDSGGYAGNWWQRMIGPRNSNFDPYGQGWGAMTILPTFKDEFAEGDKRKDAIILDYEAVGFNYDWETEQQAQYTGYSSKKYQLLSVNNTPDAVPNWQTNPSEDWMVMRFADVLLMGAELRAIIYGDGDGTALSYLNKVRERAFGNSNKNYSSASIDNIMKERKLELAGEELRYWDILRSCKGDFSKLANILTYVDETDGGDFSQTSDVYSLDVDGNVFVNNKGLFQIPPSELGLMGGVIEQNPGY